MFLPVAHSCTSSSPSYPILSKINKKNPLYKLGVLSFYIVHFTPKPDAFTLEVSRI